jgi:hypothetical protein
MKLTGLKNAYFNKVIKRKGILWHKVHIRQIGTAER